MNIRRWVQFHKARKRFILLGEMIDAIDKGFIKNNIPHYKRRQFWYDFIHYPENRKKFIQDMGKEININKKEI